MPHNGFVAVLQASLTGEQNAAVRALCQHVLAGQGGGAGSHSRGQNTAREREVRPRSATEIGWHVLPAPRSVRASERVSVLCAALAPATELPAPLQNASMTSPSLQALKCVVTQTMQCPTPAAAAEPHFDPSAAASGHRPAAAFAAAPANALAATAAMRGRAHIASRGGGEQCPLGRYSATYHAREIIERCDFF